MEKMIWKIIYLLAFLNVSVKAPRSILQCPSEEFLEELYDKRMVKLFNSMPTLVERDVVFDENDSDLLSNDCYPKENRLRDKQVSVKKYREKMQAVQCIHGLFVLNVLDGLEAIYDAASGDVFRLKLFLEPTVSDCLLGLTNMLSLLNMAKWDPHDWQVEIFTFLEGLAVISSVDDVRLYEEHFAQLKVRVRAKVLSLVGQCLQQEYLGTSLASTTTSEASMMSALVGCGKAYVDLWHSRRVLNAYQYGEHYTVENLMLQQLYSSSEKVVLDWSNYGSELELETSKVKSQLTAYANDFGRQYGNHRWQLDPIAGNKYNALILKCFYLRLMFFAWVHLRMYSVLRSRPPSVDVNAAAPLAKIWKTLLGHLMRALRVLGFKENTYWSAIHVMRDDYDTISDDLLREREEFTRNYLCQTAEDLELASEYDVGRRLREMEIPEDYDSMYNSIETNAETLNRYTFDVLFALNPVDGTFLRILVSAEGNETFVWR